MALCRRLDGLIDDLLTYSQIGRSGADSQAISLDRVIREVLETLGPAIEGRGGRVLVEGSLPEVTADATLMGRVFRNLITNGLKFNDSARPIVTISCQATDPPTLCVRDNGIGIPARNTEDIFTMFRRLHSRRKYDGSGAGLAFVRRIVEAHGGRVWVESEPGRGSTFYFTLAATPDATEMRAIADPSAVANSSAVMRRYDADSDLHPPVTPVATPNPAFHEWPRNVSFDPGMPGALRGSLSLKKRAKEFEPWPEQSL